ncbi:MAG: polyamine aminopropyltransferase [Chloroflexi bacterium]|nr:polyamine aminopropyltransferase [Chloroflexota bacterium]
MASELPTVTSRERATLLVSVLIIAICALTYELIIGTLSSYLLGNSVTQFSFTIGLFLFAMGLGALVSRVIQDHEIRWFILVELIIGIFGGFSAAILYAVFTTAFVYYYIVMVTLIIIIGVCIGLEIPLLTRIVATQGELSKALADVLSFDYLGSLVASLAFPLVLLPALGVNQTAFLMGLFNIAVAAIILRQFQPQLTPRSARSLWGIVVVFSGLMIAGFTASTSIFDFFEQQLYEDRIIYREQTPYQRIVITRKGEDIRLFLDGNLQFSSRDEYRYHEILVHPVMHIPRSREQVLVLGGGDGLVARELLKYPEVQKIVIVDIDPAITELARDYPLLRELNEGSLEDDRVELINEDAFTFVRDHAEQYPVIIADLPDPNNESLGKLYSQQFFQMVAGCLTPDGVFITQATSPYFAREAYWSIVHTLKASGFEVLPLRAYIPSFGEWGFVVGTLHKTPTLRLPESIALRFLTPDVLATATVFDPDIDEVDADINTLDDPVVVRYYEAGWREWD